MLRNNDVKFRQFFFLFSVSSAQQPLTQNHEDESSNSYHSSDARTESILSPSASRQLQPDAHYGDHRDDKSPRHWAMS